MIDAEQACCNTTLLGVLQGCAASFGLPVSPARLFGVTGHAFMINIADSICPSSPYVWDTARVLDNLPALGMSREDFGVFDAASPEAVRAALEMKIKAWLDTGKPAAVCNMENQLVRGVGPWLCTRRKAMPLRQRATMKTNYR